MLLSKRERHTLHRTCIKFFRRQKALRELGVSFELNYELDKYDEPSKLWSAIEKNPRYQRAIKQLHEETRRLRGILRRTQAQLHRNR